VQNLILLQKDCCCLENLHLFEIMKVISLLCKANFLQLFLWFCTAAKIGEGILLDHGTGGYWWNCSWEFPWCKSISFSFLFPLFDGRVVWLSLFQAAKYFENTLLDLLFILLSFVCLISKQLFHQNFCVRNNLGW
jgi:hypothetical protein